MNNPTTAPALLTEAQALALFTGLSLEEKNRLIFGWKQPVDRPVSIYRTLGAAFGGTVDFPSAERAQAYIARMEEIYGPSFTYFWRP